MIKLIASDLDGTLVNDEGEINPKIFKIIKELKEKGIMFAACSGRLYSTLNTNFKDAESDMIFIGLNGAIIQYKDNGEVISKSIIKDELVKQAIDFSKTIDSEIYISDRDYAYIKNPSEDIKKRFTFGGVPIAPVDSLYKLDQEILKIGFFERNGIKQASLEKIKDFFKDKLEVVVAGDVWIDIMNMDVSKGAGIKSIQKRFGIKKEETMAFGDFYNDLTMFKRAHFSYAMENAPEDVKRQANFRAKSNNEDGVIQVISKLVS